MGQLPPRRPQPQGGGPNATAEHGHYSSALCHLANISYRLGEKVPFNSKTKTLGDNREVVATFMNLQENLKGVGVRLDETTYQLGRTLTVDPTNERFVGEGAEAANLLLTRRVSCAVRRAGHRVASRVRTARGGDGS